MARQRSEMNPGDAGTQPFKEGESRPVGTVGAILRGEFVARQPQSPNMEDVARRLWTKFGPGDNASLRRELYERCERAVVEFGPPAYRVIQGCVKSAASAKNPDRYFCASVANRMREAGFFTEGSGGSF